MGIDPSAAMIGWAQRQYHAKEYPNLRFQEGSFLEPDVAGPFDGIVSFCALQHCPDQLSALRNVRALLKPRGRLLVLVPAMHNAAWNQARTAVQNRPEWAPYWEKVAPRKFLSASQYQELLELAGFHAIAVQELDTVDPFIDLEELLVWLEGTFTPVVPLSERRRFYLEWVEEYLRLDPEAARDGVVFIKLGVIRIEAGLD